MVSQSTLPACRAFTHSHFPSSLVGKESACSAGDPSSIPGSGRSAEEGIGYPPQYSWASLVAQLVKNLPAMRESWVPSLGWEDSPGEGKGCALQYSGLENSMDCIVHGVAKSWTRLSDFPFLQRAPSTLNLLTCAGLSRSSCLGLPSPPRPAPGPLHWLLLHPQTVTVYFLTAFGALHIVHVPFAAFWCAETPVLPDVSDRA